MAQLVARVLWEHDAAGSNPVTPTKNPLQGLLCKGFLIEVKGERDAFKPRQKGEKTTTATGGLRNAGDGRITYLPIYFIMFFEKNLEGADLLIP